MLELCLRDPICITKNATSIDCSASFICRTAAEQHEIESHLPRDVGGRCFLLANDCRIGQSFDLTVSLSFVAQHFGRIAPSIP